MYKRCFYSLLFLLLSVSAFCQENSEARLLDSIKFKAEQIFGVDNFGTFYYSDKNGSFYTKSADTTISYANFQLGKITSANAFNPLKINLFYQDFNTVIILDNRLAEILKVDFNLLEDYKNVSFISTGFDNTLWLFNQDLQQLELYDYMINKTRFKAVPIQSRILDLKSDYNYCFMLTEAYLYVYNYFGSLLQKIENTGFTKMAFSKAHVVLKKENTLFLLPKNSTKIQPIKHPDLLINQFLVTNQTVYIYNNEMLHRYQLKQP
jgi:hypothetical protein